MSRMAASACLTRFVTISACMSCLTETLLSDLPFKAEEKVMRLMSFASNSLFVCLIWFVFFRKNLRVGGKNRVSQETVNQSDFFFFLPKDRSVHVVISFKA